MTASELADSLCTARAVVYRLLRTLENHQLVGRSANRYVLGMGLAGLASQLQPRLQEKVRPILRRLTRATGSTSVLSVSDGDEALILMTEVPPESALHLVMRQGSRHPLRVGAHGVAILAGRPASEDDTPDVRQARGDGFAITTGALQPGACGIAAPIRTSEWATASIGIVQLGIELFDPDLPTLVAAAADDAARGLVGSTRAASAGT
jgi:DNA-binding IclR family transcriptional regulator